MGDGKAEGGRGNFKVIAKTEAEEQAYDFVQFRNASRSSGVIGSVAHMVKGALGAGILGGHVAYMKGGFQVGLAISLFCGLYIAYCLYLLVWAAQVLYRRTHMPTLSYPDIGEAACACFPNPKVARFSKPFRYIIDTIICLDLFGACACYQLIIAKSIKQLVENTQRTSLQGIPGYPSLRIYLLIIVGPIVLICLIRHLNKLAPFSIGANFVILIAVITAVYYAFENNPNFENLAKYNEPVTRSLEATGMIVFSMSCAGIVIPVENNMKDPKKFPIALAIGMFLISVSCVMVSFFGYVAYRDNCEAPITVNFPMTVFPKILKGLIAVMIYVTHAVNFWPPFDICFYYIKKRHAPEKVKFYELFYRALFVILIFLIAVAFPNITALMGFLGAVCLSNMAFIWPNIIYMLVMWERPGLGKFYWRLWRSLAMLAVGFFICFLGGMVNAQALVNVFISANI